MQHFYVYCAFKLNKQLKYRRNLMFMASPSCPSPGAPRRTDCQWMHQGTPIPRSECHNAMISERDGGRQDSNLGPMDYEYPHLIALASESRRSLNAFLLAILLTDSDRFYPERSVKIRRHDLRKVDRTHRVAGLN
jgi:hypothetical protein